MTIPKNAPGSAHMAQELIDILRNPAPTFVLTHDNPDPDAIAAALALQVLIERCLGRRAELIYGGIIGRAENRALVDLLDIQLRPVCGAGLTTAAHVVMVDTQPEAGNDSLPPGLLPRAVIDHHYPRQSATDRVPFVDLRPDYGACSTVLTEYLDALGVPIDCRLATALFYGIKVDTQELGRRASPADVAAYLELFPLADKLLLPKIQYPALPRAYFETLHQALKRALLYGEVVLASLDEVENPNIVAEVADLLLRLEGTSWSACLGRFGDHLLVSVRTSDPDANAHALVRQAIGPLGTGGGHSMLAGGRIALDGLTRGEIRRLRDDVIGRLLRALGQSDQPSALLRREARRRGPVAT